jgi:hypothetical protein
VGPRGAISRCSGAQPLPGAGFNEASFVRAEPGVPFTNAQPVVACECVISESQCHDITNTYTASTLHRFDEYVIRTLHDCSDAVCGGFVSLRKPEARVRGTKLQHRDHEDARSKQLK